MNSQAAFEFTFDFFASKPIVVEPSAAQVSSDGGLLPFRQLDEQIGLTQQFAEALIDRRNVGYIDHTFLEMTRMRIYGILADYPDQNDHDVLRSDPIFKLILFCSRRTLSIAYVLEFSTSRQEKLDVEANAFYA
ncbi:MAG: transposase [Thermoguttaceae bacterium]|jgi:hypothetical protein